MTLLIMGLEVFALFEQFFVSRLEIAMGDAGKTGVESKDSLDPLDDIIF